MDVVEGGGQVREEVLAVGHQAPIVLTQRVQGRGTASQQPGLVLALLGRAEQQQGGGQQGGGQHSDTEPRALSLRLK